MKLSFKIFWGICIPAIISVLVISIILVDTNHKTNIESATKQAILEMQKIENNLEDSIDDSGEINLSLVEIIDEYYKDKGGCIFLYDENGDTKYNSVGIERFENLYILNVPLGKYYTFVDNEEKCLYVSTKIDGKNTVVYEKNIAEIFDIRENLIKICVVTMGIGLLIIAVIAYIIAKTITRPLDDMQLEMYRLSKGDFSIELKEGKDEFGTLAKSFNKMSKEIENRNNELMEQSISKQLFIDNLSHEMNTPLTSILGYAELMEKANLSEEQRIKYLRYIEEESKRIMDMYKKLLLISYKKNSDLEKKEISLAKVFKEVEVNLSHKLNENKIELIINNQLSEMYGDETLIIMCVSNLIKNAINVSKENDKIIVNAFEMDKKYYIQVVDQGTGISKEDIKKIIEPFYRVDKVRSRKNGGAGLGLSICKSIIEMHGGELKIESELGKGSIFILEFPSIESIASSKI